MPPTGEIIVRPMASIIYRHMNAHCCCRCVRCTNTITQLCSARLWPSDRQIHYETLCICSGTVRKSEVIFVPRTPFSMSASSSSYNVLFHIRFHTFGTSCPAQTHIFRFQLFFTHGMWCRLCYSFIGRQMYAHFLCTCLKIRWIWICRSISNRSVSHVFDAQHSKIRSVYFAIELLACKSKWSIQFDMR